MTFASLCFQGEEGNIIRGGSVDALIVHATSLGKNGESFVILVLISFQVDCFIASISQSFIAAHSCLLTA